MGINILTNAEVTKVDTSGAGCNVFIKTQKGEEQIACDVVLSAVGVQTNIENIGLEELGIKTERGRVLVDDFYQTNVPGIYAIGDIIPGPALAHVASAEGIICVEKITGHHPEPLNYTNIPGCTYAQPEIASVGYTEAEAKAKGYEVRCQIRRVARRSHDWRQRDRNDCRGFFSGCSTVTEEAGFKEIVDFYGGSVFLKKGVNISTTATEPQGSYLEVDLNTPGISRYYSDLQIPASNCALLVYKHLRPKQRTDYSYFKIVIQDSTASHAYTFSPADLDFATQSIENLNELMFSLQGADFSAITSKLDPAAIGAINHDSVTATLRR
nr:dihydrolipoamide dehydrogenase [Tanacetum cinerariifolium]